METSRPTARFAFDLDGTLTRREILGCIAKELLAPDRYQSYLTLTEAGQENPNAYLLALSQRIQLLSELPLAQIHRVVAQIPRQEPLCAWIRAHKDQCLILTHNLPAWVAPLTDALGCPVLGSVPLWQEGRIAGLASATHKASQVEALVEQGHSVIAIGDGINDVGMFQAAHWGIAWGGVHPPAPALQKVAHARIDCPEKLCQALDALVRRPPEAFLGPALSGVYEAIARRRDVRRFVPNTQVDPHTLQRLRTAFYQSPSVGLMQPARVIEIESQTIRTQLHAMVEQERQATATTYKKQEGPDRANKFLSLKVEGILECAALWVVTLRDQRDGEIFGRRTLPHMDLASASCAIQNLWLAARAEGLGMGWVSIFSPSAVAKLLDLPKDAEAIAILCIGPAVEFLDKPRLVHDNWRVPREMSELFYRDRWPNASTAPVATPSPHYELVLGGQRSGKSEYAESRCLASGQSLHYLATCTAWDEEMQTRIDVHQARRDKRWQTHEVPLHLGAALRELARPDRCILVDCLTLWLSNCLHHDCLEAETQSLLEALVDLPGSVYLVGSLVGQGVIPMEALSRSFVDQSGRLYQDLAPLCHQVTQVTAGLPLGLKSSPR